MKKLIVAVSGGVDSVVLLDMLAKKHSPDELIVAHFDHGIRGEESKADARFVEALAKKYSLKFELGEGGLSENASEEIARVARYAFLRDVAKREKATIVTAHHWDDFLETAVINIIRGTGWRGLAVMSAKDIDRPLQQLTKSEIYEYAVEHSLEFVEDVTNRDMRYLRNRVRADMSRLSEQLKQTLDNLIRDQQQIADSIDQEVAQFEAMQTSRYFYIMADPMSAKELLTAYFRQTRSISLTRPTLNRVLLAIKTAHAGTMVDIINGIQLEMKQREFAIRDRGKVL